MAPAAAIQALHTGRGRTTLSTEGGGNIIGSRVAKDYSPEEALTASSSSANVSAVERAELDQIHQGQDATGTASVDHHSTSGSLGGGGESFTTDRRGYHGGFGLVDAVLEAAQELANNCQTPGISEAATVVSILVNLVSDSRDSDSDARLRQCRAIITMLERAAKVVGKVRRPGPLLPVPLGGCC